MAGLDTVTASLDCMMLNLAMNPDRRQQIVDDPAINPNAVEELVRWASNRHIAFGCGPHRCLGPHLARLELRIALEVWHEMIPDHRLPEVFEPAFQTSIRSLRSLPLVLASPG